MVLRRGVDGATITFHPERGPPGTEPLDEEARRPFADGLESEDADSLPPYEPTVWDGVQHEYLHLTPSGGRRLLMDVPGSWDEEDRTEDACARIVRAFHEVSRPLRRATR